MSRPEHVRCENCCFWIASVGERGECRRQHPTVTERLNGAGFDASKGAWLSTMKRNWCGEFRREWPTEESGPRIHVSRPSPITSGHLRLALKRFSRDDPHHDGTTFNQFDHKAAKNFIRTHDDDYLIWYKRVGPVAIMLARAWAGEP